MADYRFSAAAREDITHTLDWSFDNFGEAAQARYAALISAAVRHAAATPDGVGFEHHPEYGEGIMTWHLSLSVQRSKAGRVKNPRHILVCRREEGVLVIGRVLDHSMDPLLHLDPQADWE